MYSEYFSDEKVAPKGELLFVDGGTYVGDTISYIIEKYKEKVSYIWGFEPDDNNYLLAKANIPDAWKMKCKIIKKGLYNIDSELRFKLVNDELSIDKKGDICVETCRLDSIIDEIEVRTKTLSPNDIRKKLCIKMDLEGSEKYALEGSKEVIQRYHPYLAICLYHRLQDISDIPRTILNIRKDYSFYLRAGVHTELYAVPNGDI